MGKIILVVSIVVSLLTAAVGFLNRSKLEDARGEAAEMTRQLQAKEEVVAQAKGDLAKAQEDLAVATKAKDDMQSELNAAKSQVEQEKSRTGQFDQQLKDKDTQIETLTNDNKAKDTRIAELEAEKIGGTTPAATGPDPAELQMKIAEQETLIEKLQSDLSGSRAQLEELRERERNRAAQVMRGGLEGKILAVNQAWNFVVLSLGDRNGVVSNAEMLVKRGTQMIGKVRITSVEPSTSIADIVANSVPRGLAIQPGDHVIYVGSPEE